MVNESPDDEKEFKLSTINFSTFIVKIVCYTRFFIFLPGFFFEIFRLYGTVIHIPCFSEQVRYVVLEFLSISAN